MITKRSASTCKWAKPTMSMPLPTWLEAWDRPWTCVRDETPTTLETTERCEDCPRWEPRQADVVSGRNA
ncbi:MAG: hypothetical protein ACM3SQ_14060 [Betaproteobacteria bacterium]